MSAETVSRQTLRDQVERVIREAILLGEFEPGQRLSEPELAKRFDVSLTPVREALGSLAATGLVIRNGRYGTYVRVLSSADIEHILSIREALEVLAVKQAVPNLTASAEQRFGRLLERQAQATELATANRAKALKQLADQNEQFHRLILELADNEWLTTMLVGIQDLFVFARSRLRSRATLQRRQASLEEHRLIVAALLEGAADKAAQRMGEHVRNLKKSVIPLVPTTSSASAPSLARATDVLDGRSDRRATRRTRAERKEGDDDSESSRGPTEA